MKPPAFQHHVALMAEFPYSRELFRGITSWLRKHQGWRISYLHSEMPPLPTRLDVDGILATPSSDDARKAISALGKPWVEIGGDSRHYRGIAVACDDDAVGVLAAQHFLARGYRNFAYAGPERVIATWDQLRQQGFRRQLDERGFTCSHIPLMILSSSWKRQDEANRQMLRLSAWLRSQPKPLAVFGGNDWHAWEIMRVCNEIGVKIPDEVAVLGTDNSDPCDISDPPLSSIPLPNEQLGYAAAELVQRMFDGETDLPPLTLIPPLPVIMRRSSDAFAVDDPELAEALRMIERRFAEPIGTEDLARHVMISRRALERRFREHLGKTPYDQLLQARLNHARHLLRSTDIPIPDLARQCGFSGAASLGRAFSPVEGIGPGTYRRKARGR